MARINIIPMTGDTPLSFTENFLTCFDIINPGKVIHTLLYNILLHRHSAMSVEIKVRLSRCHHHQILCQALSVLLNIHLSHNTAMSAYHKVRPQ